MSDDEYEFIEEEYDFDGEEAGEDNGNGDEAGYEEGCDGAENTFQDAKNCFDAGDLQGAIVLYKQMLVEDREAARTGAAGNEGYWTWKAYKNLAKCAHKLKDFEGMTTYFRQMLQTTYNDRNDGDGEKIRGRNDVEKAVTKFLDRVNHTLEDGVAIEFYIMVNQELILSSSGRRSSLYEKLWFSIKMKICQITLSQKKYTQLETDLAELMSFCHEGENAEQRKGTMLLTVVALEMQMQTELNNVQRLRELYNLAMSVKSAILPPKQMGIIRECGGKIFMRQSLWQEAYDAFGAAFRAFDEAGHPRRISCLKYLVLASMLSGSKINPFDTNEARSYQNDPEIKAMTELITACANNDINTFDRVLKDKKNAEVILNDTFLYSFLEPLIRKIRCKVLQVLSKPYKTLKLTYVAQELMLKGGEKEAEALVVSMILDGSLKEGSSIDQLQGLIKLGAQEGGIDGTGGGGGDRYRHLHRWCNQQQVMQDGIVNRAAILAL